MCLHAHDFHIKNVISVITTISISKPFRMKKTLPASQASHQNVTTQLKHASVPKTNTSKYFSGLLTIFFLNLSVAQTYHSHFHYPYVN